MKVVATKLYDASEFGSKKITKRYTGPEGLCCRQTLSVSSESDYVNSSKVRTSTDNGKTWSEWEDIPFEDISVMYGEDEFINAETVRVWNPVHKHYVSTYWTRYFIEGHEKAYKGFWKRGEHTFFDHQYVAISETGDGKNISRSLVKYEDGEDFNPDNPRNPKFLNKNCGFLNDVTVLKNGDIAVAVGVPIDVGCRIAGLDVNKVFPSCPTIHRCVIVARGKYNEKMKQYDLAFSNPVILNDLRSSRGIDEPIVVELSSSRLLLVMRGSNVKSEAWNTRIEDGTPSFKWYSYSDDGGKTFTEAEPWRFDDREIIYSAATISKFIRSSKNGKLYWVGNIAPHTAYGNFPRYPLYIAEVNEKLGLLKKEGLTVIDTKGEGDTDKIQLSNFDIIEDRESKNFELTLEKIGQFDADRPFYCETWHYEIVVE